MKCNFIAEVPCSAVWSVCYHSWICITNACFFIIIKTTLRRNFNENELKIERYSYYAVVISCAIGHQWCL